MSDEDKAYIDDENRFIINHLYNSWQIKLIGDEFRDALLYDKEQHSKNLAFKKIYQIPSDDFDKCLKKYGFNAYSDKDYELTGSNRGYVVFEGDRDTEMYIKISFQLFDNIEADNNFEISSYYNDDKEYTNEIIEIHWKTIFENIYRAITVFLRDEDCSGERAKEEAKEEKRRLIRQKEEAIEAKYELKKDIERKAKESREKTLGEIKEKVLKKHNVESNTLTNISSYNSNRGYESPNLKDVKLVSHFNSNTHVDHQFIIAIKNKEYIDAVDEDERISYSDLNNIILLPVWSLSMKQFLCIGLSKSFLKDSIIRSDITIALVEPTAERDDSYFAGVATLIVKDDAIEIDTICSQIGYKMGGRLLMNKIITIARKLGKSKIELLSLKNPSTVRFYKRFLFKKVRSNNNFGKIGTRKGLLPLRRRITRKKPAGGAGKSN